MTAWTIETDIDPADVVSEDSGTHLVVYGVSDDECPLYVRLLSESNDPEAEDAHAALRSLVGRRVRVTIELVG